MGEMILCAAMGYGLGQISPAAFLSKLKKKDLREYGTGNLGATNTMLVFGKVCGIFVLIVDVLKAFFAIKLAKRLFPLFQLAGLVAGCFAVIGHIFPIYMKFNGGKGVATFAGLMLAYDIRTLLIILGIAIVFMIATNKGVWGPVSAAIVFPTWLLIKVKSLIVFGSVSAVGALMVYKHRDNFKRLKEGNEILVNEFAGEMKNYE